MFGGGDDISGPYDPTPVDETDFSICGLQYVYDDLNDEFILETPIENTEVSNLWPESILNTTLRTNNKVYSFQSNNFSSLFYNTARTTSYFTFPPIIENGSSTIIDFENSLLIIPYTNVILVDKFDIISLFGSQKLLRRSPSPSSFLILEDLLDCFGARLSDIRESLDNSIYIDYALVNAVFSNQTETKGGQFKLESLAFIHYANN